MVTVERPGFKTSHVSDVGITVGLIATINVKLEVGAVQNEIRVETSAVQLEQQSSSLGSVVTSSQILELPLSGRNPYALVTQSASVVG